MTPTRYSHLLLGMGGPLLGLAACIQDPGNPRIDVQKDDIIGGTATTIEQAPWQVALVRRSGAQFCGGVLLTSSMVMTAQHCISDGSSDIHVVAGATRLSERTGSLRGDVIAVSTYPGFTNPRFGGDVALLQVNADLFLPPQASFIQRVTAEDERAGATNEGVVATVTGWGGVSETVPMPSDVLQTVDVPIVSNEHASQLYGETITADQIAAGLVGVGGKDSCGGDDGGPITVHVGGVAKLAGVVSWGRGCGDANFPGLYARTSAFETYITERVFGRVDGSLQLRNVSGTRNSLTHRTVTVPAGARTLSVVVRGGTGDADLYVRHGSQPTATAFQCRPFLSGNDEFCSIDAPLAGTWFFSLHGFTAYSGVSVTVTVITYP